MLLILFVVYYFSKSFFRIVFDDSFSLKWIEYLVGKKFTRIDAIGMYSSSNNDEVEHALFEKKNFFS